MKHHCLWDPILVSIHTTVVVALAGGMKGLSVIIGHDVMGVSINFVSRQVVGVAFGTESWEWSATP